TSCTSLRSLASHLRLLLHDEATSEIYTLSLHDALPISRPGVTEMSVRADAALRRNFPTRLQLHQAAFPRSPRRAIGRGACRGGRDRKSTRLNSSHVSISYAVFCLKKKKYTLS